MDEQTKNTTSPPDAIHEATTPPGQGEVDEAALEAGRRRLVQAAGEYE